MEQGSRGIKFAALVLQKLHTLHSSLGHFYANSTFCGKSHHTARGSQLQAALSTQRSTLTSRLYHAPSSLITQKKLFSLLLSFLGPSDIPASLHPVTSQLIPHGTSRSGSRIIQSKNKSQTHHTPSLIQRDGKGKADWVKDTRW